ncbi:MAG: hypothetical protein J0M12_07230 [Deltaproteobacteria bacterium]|nr:hypothetical protein [Deltaproteobacteria bacterium]
MTTSERSANLSAKLCKFVQGGRAEAPDTLPQAAVLADVLKTVETQLASRGFLRDQRHDCFNPIWYLAETERNVFLWKRGCSVLQQDEFEFWIDINALIEKRLRQLDSFDSQNPFLNPLWSVATPDRDSAEYERQYLLSFAEAMRQIETHLHALSRLGSLLINELEGETEQRERVILPTPTPAVK